jgi:crotonobetainyl-CoA:carnitine CoA-transferase CaiB-like acyl-CoA transferase
LYQTLDGKRVAVAAIEEEFWLNLLRELNLDELKDMRAGDRAGREKLKEKLRQTFARKTRDDWGRLLMDKETCTTPVLDFTGALRSAWTGSLRPIGWSSQKRKSFTILGTPLRFSKQTRLKNRPAPKLGEDTARVLKRLGYSVSRLRALRERQVVA